MIGVTRREVAADVAVAIDRTFQNSLAETLTETEKAFQMGFVSMSETIITAIQIVSFVVIVILLAVVANTMAMASRERIGEYAILKTLGFSGFQIAALIWGESLLVTFLGCVLGMALTFPAAKAFGEAMGTFMPVFNVGKDTLYLDLAAFFVVGTAAAIIPAWRAVNIRIADALRRIG
jgi:putative ABC transport system permease protein